MFLVLIDFFELIVGKGKTQNCLGALTTWRLKENAKHLHSILIISYCKGRRLVVWCSCARN